MNATSRLSLLVLVAACSSGARTQTVALTEARDTTSGAPVTTQQTSPAHSSQPTQQDAQPIDTKTDTPTTCEPGEIVPCYDGPSGTAGIGACAAGIRTCAADGSGFSACEDQVLPRDEDCATADSDEDCDGQTACTGALSKLQHFRGASFTTTSTAAKSADGGVVVGGSFLGKAVVGDATATSQRYDAFITRFAADGRVMWAQTLEGANSSGIHLVANDDATNEIYVRGFTDSPSTIGGHAIASGPFLVKLAANGDFLWSTSIAANVYLRAAGFDAEHNPIFVGSMNGTADLGAGPVQSASPTYDALVLALDKDNGSYLWSKLLGGINVEQANDVAMLNGGTTAVVVGTFCSAMSFDGVNQYKANGCDGFMVGLDTQNAGAFQWVRRFSGDGLWDSVDSVSVDAEGGIIAAGTFSLSMTMPLCPTLVGAAPSDLFIARYSVDGDCTFAQRYGDPVNAEATPKIASYFDAEAGAIRYVLAGHAYTSTLDLGGGMLPGDDNNPNIYVAELNEVGAHLWSKGYGDEGDAAFFVEVSEAQTLVRLLATNDGITLVGNFGGSLGFGGADPGSLALQKSGFVTKLHHSDFVWKHVYGDADDMTVRRLAESPDGSRVLAGSFQSKLNLGDAVHESSGYDAFIARQAKDGTVIWSKRFGGAQNDHGEDDVVTALTTDAAGNIYVFGHFVGALSFDDVLVDGPSYASENAFVAKLSSSGVLQWLRAYAVAPANRASIQGGVDSAGNVIFATTFEQPLDLQGATLEPNGNADVALVKLSANGELLWPKRLGGTDTDDVGAVAIGPGNEIFLGMTFRNTTCEVDGASLPNKGLDDIAIVRFSQDGQREWVKAYGSTQNDGLVGISRAKDAPMVVIAGEFGGPITFAGAPTPFLGGPDAFVLSLSPNDGSYKAHALIASTSAESLTGIAIDALGQTVVMGETNGESLDVGDGELAYAHAFVVKYDASLTRVWGRSFGPQNTHPLGIAAGRGGHTLVVGHTQDALQFPLQKPMASMLGVHDGFLLDLVP